MPNYICTTCGTQYAETDQAPGACTICQDERQYVKATGQQWATLDRLRLTNRNSIKFNERGLIGIGTERTSLSASMPCSCGRRRSTSSGTACCCSTKPWSRVVEAIKAMGGISAIAISHLHYYSSMVEWSRAFGGVPIYLHAADCQWAMRPDKAIVFWEGETKLLAEG